MNHSQRPTIQLTDEDLDEFIRLYRNKTGVTLTREEAIEPAMKLVLYVRAVAGHRATKRKKKNPPDIAA